MAAPVALTDDGQLFTRGGPNMVDTRGASLVAKHLEKQQKEKESRALEKVKVLLPRLGPTVRTVALHECGWDEERAVLLLRRFQVSKAEELGKVQKERRRHQLLLQKGKVDAGHHHHHHKQQQGGSGGESASGSDSDDSGSGSEDERKGSKRRRGSRSPSRRDSKRSKKERRSSGSKNQRKEKRRKKEKKEKKDKAKPKISKGAIGEDYGKYGIIRETDLYAKRPEFQLWAMEIKGVDLEVVPRAEEKEMFKDYMEEYNTATLPHQKFYDLELHEKKEAAKAAKKGAASAAAAAATQERNVFDDETERKREIAIERARRHQGLLAKAYVDLKTDANKYEDMKEQRLLRAEMELAYKTGDRTQAARIAARLEPDDPMAPKAPRAPKH